MRGKKNNISSMDISQLAIIIGNIVCTPLLSVHAWTRYDSVSAFAGQGNIKPLKLIQISYTFLVAFEALRVEWNVSDELF